MRVQRRRARPAQARAISSWSADEWTQPPGLVRDRTDRSFPLRPSLV